MQGEAGARQFGVEAVDLGALLLQLLLGGVVRLGGLLGIPVQLLKVRQQLGHGPLSGCLRIGYGRGGQRCEDGADRHRRRTDQT